MKLLGTLSGIAAINIAGEQATPERGILQRDLISYLSILYNFSINPPSLNNPEVGTLPILQFQSGVCAIGNEVIPISQIVVTSDGDAVSAQNTDLADAVLSDYLSHLEENLHFRFSQWKLERLYHSFLLVEFEQHFIDSMIPSPLLKIVNEVTNARNPIFTIKRVALGRDASNYSSSQPTIHQFLSKDFVIERRANEPMESNRFFCTAPLTTGEHVEALARIEAAF